MRYASIIDNFTGEYRWLSNFWVYDPDTGMTVEHRYQAAKASNYSDWYDIMHADTPFIAKRMGKVIEVRADWEHVKLSLMEEFVRDKFIKNVELREKLINTSGTFLIEGNTWGDTFWGVCNGIGENHLGKILMRIRDDFFNHE